MDILGTPTGSYGASGPPGLFPSTTTALFLNQATPVDYAFEQKSSHPDFWHLAGLVCEAVLEVVCVSSLGYIAAKRGLFSAKVQKDVANLNIYFFTPCLIFSKLAAQLTGDKLTELWIIPIILFVQTIVSWLAAEGGVRVFGIRKTPQRNFVFGNSNSLPLSLVISLSHTISGLHWDRVPADNDDEVGARGILYLLVFSQLGQAVRWSWGMNTLLRPMEEYTPEERGETPHDSDEEGFMPYRDESDSDGAISSPAGPSRQSSNRDLDAQIKTDEFANPSGQDESPQTNGRDTLKVPENGTRKRSPSPFRRAAQITQDAANEFATWRDRSWNAARDKTLHASNTMGERIQAWASRVFSSLPPQLQKALTNTWYWVSLVVSKIVGCLNVPLVAIILSVIVGSVPGLKAFFYTRGTFVNNTVTSAINQLGGVAVPLILFVLGGNLCKSTLPTEDPNDHTYKREKGRMLWCSLVCRMLIPTIIMAPLLAILAKFTPISILDDPIFIIVAFLLTGAPSALQLAQICQVNDVYVPVISQLLVQSYVVWIFPSTLVLVMLALEVVKWAA